MRGGGQREGGKITVLYVDDEPSLLFLAKEFLEMEGDVQVDTYPSAAKALEDLATKRYDVVISDYMMAHLDGVEFLRLLRERGDRTPFVLFTGRGREEVAIKALNLGADFYVQKSGDPAVQFGELRNVILQLAYRRRAEVSLHEREEQLRLITDHMRDVVVRVDEGDTITYVSPSVERITGFTVEEVLGRRVQDFIHPDDLARVVETADRVIAERGELTIEYRQLRKDGTYLWMESRGVYLYDEQGKVRSSIFTLRDVSARRRFEEGLRESERRYRELTENLNALIVRLDGQCRITYMNDVALRFFGYSKEEVLGRHVIGTIVPEREEGTGRDLRALMQDMVTRPTHFAGNINQNVKRNGERAWVAWTNRFVDGNEGAREILSMGVDITAHHLSEEMLEMSHTLLRSVLDSTTDAILVLGLDGQVKAVNRQLLDLLGLPGELMERSMEEVSEAVLGRLKEEEFQAMGRSALGPAMGLKVEVKGRQYRMSATAHRMDGQVVGRVWSIHDITEESKAQEALAERESKLSAIFSNPAVGIGLIDRDGHIVEGNEAMTHILGYTMEEFRGTDFADYAHPEELEEEARLYREVVEGKRDHYVVERRFKSKGGRDLWLRVMGSAVRDPEGRFRFGLGFFQDVTEQREAQEALQRSEARYRLLASNYPNGFVLLYDPDLRYFIAEGRGLGEIGLSKAQMEGRTVAEIFPQPSAAAIEAGYRRTLSGETTVQTIEFRGRVYRAFSTPLLAEDGTVYGGMVMTQDITDLKRTEADLRRLNRSLSILSAGDRAQMEAGDEEELYRLVCRALVEVGGHDLTLAGLADEQGRVRLTASCGRAAEQACRLLTSEDGLGDKTLREDRPMVIDLTDDDPVLAGLREEGFRSAAFLPLRHQGRPVGYLGVLSTKTDAFDRAEADLLSELAGGLGRGIAAFREQTHRRRSEEALARRGQQLEQANRKLDLLASITRHDLLNQLTALVGFLDLGRSGCDPAASAYLDRARASADNIVKHLSFAQDYRALGTSLPVWIPLREAVRQGASTVALGDVALKIDLEGLEVYADRMLEKVFHNLLDNSVRHGGKVTEVRIFAHEGPEGLTIVYQDDGLGIPPERKDELFEFTAGHHGLHMAREILSLTGMGIREVGTDGARFEITVPPDGYRRSQ